MTSRNKIAVAVVAVVTIVVIVLSISLGWSAWITIVVFAACCAIGGLVSLIPGRNDRRHVPEPPVQLPPPVPEPQQVVRTEVIEGINLASAWPDYEFNLRAIVHWRSTGLATQTPHVRPGAVAIETIIQRAARVASDASPDTVIRLQHLLNDVLGVIEPDPSGRVEAWADQVQTALLDEDAARLRALANIRKNKVLWEHERRYECDRRRYLADDVLKSTGSALVWWLSRNEANVNGAVDLIGNMARLTAAAKDEDIPELFRHLVPSSLLPTPEAERSHLPTIGSDGAGQPFTFDLGLFNSGRSAVDLVTALMDTLNMDDDQRAQFADRVAAGVEATGDVTSADEIRRRWDVLAEESAVDTESERPFEPAEASVPDTQIRDDPDIP
jgi:hypothetical protein